MSLPALGWSADSAELEELVQRDESEAVPVLDIVDCISDVIGPIEDLLLHGLGHPIGPGASVQLSASRSPS